MDSTAANRIIDNAPTSTEALRGLYELGKRGNTKRSLAYYCKRAGIPSTGYFSDVLSGKRTLNPKYRMTIGRAFDLAAQAAACLRLLIDLDNEADPERRKSLAAKLASNRKALKVSYLPMRADSKDLFVALDVFCAFGLFHNRPTSADLQRYFHAMDAGVLASSLRLLETLGLVKREAATYVVLHDHVLFGEENGGISPIDFLQMAIAHGAKNVGTWFERKDQAYFTSAVASVKRESYTSALQEIKAKMLLVQSELGSDDADMLVRFNVQIYPISD